jgi:hypothetical protein
VVVNYNQNYFLRFPNDVIVTVCDGTGNYGEPTFFGEDCELLGVSHEDEIFTVVPDACYKIERTWTVINWCTYNPNAGLYQRTEPEPERDREPPVEPAGPDRLGLPAHRLRGTRRWCDQPGPDADELLDVLDANANCYKYKQIIK